MAFVRKLSAARNCETYRNSYPRSWLALRTNVFQLLKWKQLLRAFEAAAFPRPLMHACPAQQLITHASSVAAPRTTYVVSWPHPYLWPEVRKFDTIVTSRTFSRANHASADYKWWLHRICIKIAPWIGRLEREKALDQAFISGASVRRWKCISSSLSEKNLVRLRSS